MLRPVLLLTALAVLSAACESDDHDSGATAAAMTEGGGAMAPARTFRFTYEARIPAPPAGAERVAIWVPLPVEDPGVQEVRDLEIASSSGTARKTMEPVYGNRMIYVMDADTKGPTTVTWSATITRHEDVGQGHLPKKSAYMEANRLIPLGESAKMQAKKLGVDQAEVPAAARARRIYDDVLDSMAYDKTVPGYGAGDFQRAMTVCKGNCTDFHARFIGTGRAAGIPCRFTMGIPMKPDPEGTYNSYHCWAHWYDGDSWNPVDISEADKVADTDPQKADWFFGHLDPDRVAMTFGRDIMLSPPQKGEPLNYFIFPYVEADGRPMELDKSCWTFTWKNQ